MLVLLAVVEADFDQILLHAETVQGGVLDRPLLLPLPALDDGVNFFIGRLSWGAARSIARILSEGGRREDATTTHASTEFNYLPRSAWPGR